MPAYPKLPQFPGVDKLPAPIRGLMDFALGKQDDPAGQAMQAVGGPMTVLGEGAGGLVNVLKGLHNSINHVKSVAPEVMDIVEPHTLPPAVGEVHNMLSNFAKQMEHKELTPDEVAKLAGESRVTSHRFRLPGKPSMPQGFTVGNIQPAMAPGHWALAQRMRTYGKREIDPRSITALERAGSQIEGDILQKADQVPTVGALEELQNVAPVSSKMGPVESKPFKSEAKGMALTSAQRSFRKGGSTVTPELIREVRRLRETGLTIREIAAKVDLKMPTVQGIASGDSFRNVK